MRRHLSGIAGYAANQGLVQLVSFAVGIIAVRSLSKDDYAVYALTVAVIAAVVVVADSGLGGALMARGSQAIDDPKRLNLIFGTGLWVRARVGGAVALAGIGWLFALLSSINTGLVVMVICAAVAAVTIALQLSAGVAQTYSRLTFDTRLMKRVNLATALTRLALVGAAVAIGIQSPPILLVAAAGAAAVGCVIYFLSFRRDVQPKVGSSEERAYYLRIVGRTLPMLVLLVAGEQILLYLVALRGGADVVAEFSALSRFGIAFLVLNSVVADIGAPRFSRVTGSRRLIAIRGGQVLGAYTLGAMGLIGVVALTSPVLIAILGPDYQGLELQLVLIACGYALANVAYAWNALNQARAWVAWTWLYLPLIVSWAVVTVLFLDLSDITQVALAFILQAVPALATQFVRYISGLLRAHDSDAE